VKVAEFVREVEQRRAEDDITDAEWEIIEERAARRDLATDGYWPVPRRMKVRF
jgi:hypothetical protein